MTDILLSILVCGLYERMPGNYTEDHVVWSLDDQAKDKPVQLIALYDNRSWTVGQKRNRLLWMADGEYLAFVDDDDSVAPDYVDTLLAAIDKARGADVICFRQDCVRGDLGGLIEHCEYSLHYEYSVTETNQTDFMQVSPWSSGAVPVRTGPRERLWRGKPAHTMAWRTALVQDDTVFPEANFGEDTGWVAQACRLAKTEYQVDKTLYTYRFDPEKSRTRGR